MSGKLPTPEHTKAEEERQAPDEAGAEKRLHVWSEPNTKGTDYPLSTRGGGAATSYLVKGSFKLQLHPPYRGKLWQSFHTLRIEIAVQTQCQAWDCVARPGNSETLELKNIG